MAHAQELLHGQLDNGLSYYVRRNAKPQRRAALALVVRVGSLSETEDARGVAHFVEHLAFNATEKFERHSLVEFLEAAGLPFGACQNAYTSADETVYELLLPVDGAQHELLDQALAILAQFACKIRCSHEDVDSERGAILEEWRAGRDARGRDAEAYWKLLHGGTLYADRLPIGKEAVIRSVSPDTIRHWYTSWYRPRHMAVVAVGDWGDREDGAVVDAIRAAFDGVQPMSPDPGPEVPHVPFAPHPLTRVLCVTDRELQGTAVSVCFGHPRVLQATPRDFRAAFVSALLIECLNSRLFRVSRAQPPPFYSAVASVDDVTATMALFSLGASAPVGGALPALEAMLVELARMRLHGLTDREVAIGKARIEASIETNYVERDQSESEDLRDEYVRHFTSGEAVLDVELEARLSLALLKGISRNDLATFAAQLRGDASCILKVTCGSTDKRPPSEAELLGVLARVNAQEAEGSIPPPDVAQVPTSLMPAPPPVTPDACIVSRREWSCWQVSELTLSNGLRVAIKRTPWLDDQVLLSAFAHGGLSQLPNGRAYWSGCTSTMLAAEAGPFGHPPEVLEDILAGMRVGLTPAIGAYKRVFSGDQSPADLEHALELCHLLFTTRPSAEPATLRAAYDVAKERIRAHKRDALSRFTQAVKDTVYGPRCHISKAMTERQLASFSPDESLRYFADAFHNPAEWTVTLVGAVPDAATLEPLLVTYLGTLPRQGHPAPVSPGDIRPVPWGFPAVPVRRTVRAFMAEPQAQVQVALPVVMVTREASSSHEQARFAHEDSLWLRLACNVLQNRLLRVLRFRSGKVYSLSATHYFGMEAPSASAPFKGDCAIVLSCDPAAAWDIVDAILLEVKGLQTEGLTQEEVDTVAELERRAFEVSLEQNGTWLERVQAGYQARALASFLCSARLCCFLLHAGDDKQMRLADSLLPER